MSGTKLSENPDLTDTNPGITALQHPGRSEGRPEWPWAPSAGSQEVWPDVHPMSLGNPVCHSSLWLDVSSWMSGTREKKTHVEVCLDLKHVWREDSLKRDAVTFTNRERSARPPRYNNTSFYLSVEVIPTAVFNTSDSAHPASEKESFHPGVYHTACTGQWHLALIFTSLWLVW